MVWTCKQLQNWRPRVMDFFEAQELRRALSVHSTLYFKWRFLGVLLIGIGIALVLTAFYSLMKFLDEKFVFDWMFAVAFFTTVEFVALFVSVAPLRCLLRLHSARKRLQRQGLAVVYTREVAQFEALTAREQ